MAKLVNFELHLHLQDETFFVNHFQKEGEKIARDLKRRGMDFVGSTIIYALMQAVGMVNNHEVSCFRYSQV